MSWACDGDDVESRAPESWAPESHLLRVVEGIRSGAGLYMSRPTILVALGETITIKYNFLYFEGGGV